MHTNREATGSISISISVNYSNIAVLVKGVPCVGYLKFNITCFSRGTKISASRNFVIGITIIVTIIINVTINSIQ